MTNETSDDDDDRPEPCARRGARAARPAETASGAERDIIILLLYFTTAERLRTRVNNNNNNVYYSLYTASYGIITLYIPFYVIKICRYLRLAPGRDRFAVLQWHRPSSSVGNVFRIFIFSRSYFLSRYVHRCLLATSL